MDPFTPKKVDESWKDSVQKEREKAEPSAAAVPEAPENDFLSFISTLTMQALAALGEVSLHPDQPPHTDLRQAQYLIDVIQMLADKTKGNITAQETDAVNNLLYELRMKFVSKKQEAL